MAFDIALVSGGSGFDISMLGGGSPPPDPLILNLTDDVVTSEVLTSVQTFIRQITDTVATSQTRSFDFSGDTSGDEVDFIDMDTVIFNTISASEYWNPESSTFTAPEDGTYNFSSIINWESHTVGRRRLQFEYTDNHGTSQVITAPNKCMAMAKNANVIVVSTLDEDGIKIFSGTDFSTVTTITSSPFSVNCNPFVWITDDGATIFAYIMAMSTNEGKLYTFTGAGWATATMIINIGTLLSMTSGFMGTVVSGMTVSGDGSVVIIPDWGYPTPFVNAPGRFIVRYGASWATTTYINNPEPLDQFGDPLTLSWLDKPVISGDNTVIAMANMSNERADHAPVGTGVIHLFHGATWATHTVIVATDPIESGYYGWSMALSQDGSVLAIGTYYRKSYGSNYDLNGNNYGSVHIRSGTLWADEVTHLPTNRLSVAGLGATVAINDDGSIVTALSEKHKTYPLAPTDTENPSWAGALYRFSGTNWDTVAIYEQDTYITGYSVAGLQYYWWQPPDYNGHSFIGLSGDGSMMSVADENNGGTVLVIKDVGVPATIASNEVPSSVSRPITKQGLTANLHMRKGDTLSVSVAHTALSDINILEGSEFVVTKIAEFEA